MNNEEILLRKFKPRSALVLDEHIPAKARYPIFDMHNHFGKWRWNNAMHAIDYQRGEWQMQDIPAALDLMEEMNICKAVNLDGGWGDTLRMNLDRYKAAYPDRFSVFAWADWTRVDEPNFGEKWAKELEKSVSAGASGLKLFKSLGLTYRDKFGKLIKFNDPRLDPIWAKAGELNIPVLIHTGDPVAFFCPVDETNERWEELYEHPDWHFYGKDYPSFMELVGHSLEVFERHPGTKFISAHILGYSENLDFVSKALDKYSNVYVDIAERISELGRQPYSSRKFFIKYADRIMFGTDTFAPDRKKYQTYFRFLETEDEYFEYGRNQGRWNIYGINLPDDVLQKIYMETASKLIR